MEKSFGCLTSEILNMNLPDKTVKFYELGQLSCRSHNGRQNASLMVLTACNCVTRSSQANFVLKSCLAQVIFGSPLSGLCAPRGSPFCCWCSTIWSLHPLTAGRAKEGGGGGRREREEKGAEGKQWGEGDAGQMTDAIELHYLDECDTEFYEMMDCKNVVWES